jgi:DNA-binding beta-propeller fold protein YncE
VGQDSVTSPKSIVALDPRTGEVRATVTTATAPKLLALSAGGEYLYAAMSDINLIRRFRLPLLQADLDMQVGTPTARFTQIAVAPNNAHTLAVAGAELDVLGNRTFGELAIYDDAQRRPNVIDVAVIPVQRAPLYINGIAWDPSGSTLYSALRLEFSVDAQGPTTRRYRYNTYYGRPDLHDGVIYAADGRVYDLASEQLRGAFPDIGFVTARTQRMEHGKAFAASEYGNLVGSLLRSFAVTDLNNIDTMVLEGNEWSAIEGMIPWGDDGLALRRRTSAVVITKGSFVRQEQVNRSLQVPVLYAGSIASGSDSASYRVLDLGANAAVADPCTGNLYVAVSSYSTIAPNSILALDPATGTVLKQMPATGEPINLALADDCSMLYVGFDVSDTVLRARTPALTRDLVIPIKADNDDAAFARRTDVAPGNPRTILLTKGTLEVGAFCRNVDYGVSVIDDAVERPQTYFDYPYSTQSVVWGRDQFEAFGGTALDGPARYSIDATGIAHIEPLGPPVINGTSHFDRGTGRLYDRFRNVFDVPGNAQLPRLQTDWNTAQLVNQCAFDTVVTTRGSGNVFMAHRQDDPQERVDGNGFPLIGVGIEAFDWQTQSSLSKLYVGHQLGFPVSIAAWGNDGLTVVTSGGFLIMIQGNAVAH